MDTEALADVDKLIKYRIIYLFDLLKTPCVIGYFYVSLHKNNKKYSIMAQGVVYMFTNKLNGKMYIGQTIHEDLRIKHHLYAASHPNN